MGAVVEDNRHIPAKECEAPAKTIMYGRKATLRLNAGLHAKRSIEMASAVSNVWVDDQPEERPNHVTPVMAKNIGRQYVYGEKEKVRAEAVEIGNRHIRAKECIARAKEVIYGRKEALRLQAGLEANRYIDRKGAESNLWVDDQQEQRQNHGTTTRTWLLSMSVVLLCTTAMYFAYRTYCL